MGKIDEEASWTSEFEETWGLDAKPRGGEAFTADLLEEAVEILRPARAATVDETELVVRAVAGMAERNHGCVLVTRAGVLTGIFTERDLLRRVVGRVDPETTRIRSVMTPDPEAVAFHDTVAAALNKMTVGGFRHVPLVDVMHRPVGVLSMKDFVQYFVRHFPRHVLNVAPDPSVRRPGEPAGAG